MKRIKVSEFQTLTKPLFEGSRMGVAVKNVQFNIYESEDSEFSCGFLTQYSGNSFSLCLRSKEYPHLTNNWVDMRNHLMRVLPNGYFVCTKDLT